MASDGQVVFEITGDNSPLQKTLETTTKSIQEESKKWDTAVDDSSNNISNSLIGAFTAVVSSYAFTQIGKMLWQLGVESVGLASNLEETQNRIDKAFGPEGSATIEKWAKNVSKQFGLTEFQAKTYAASLGTLFVNAGHTQEQALDMAIGLVERSADLASFYDTSFDESFQKILSAISGRTQAIKQFGVDVQVASMENFAENMGYGPYKNLELVDKQLLMYQKILQDTAIVQGDFADTADTFANSQRRIENGITVLKTELGNLLLPAAQTITDAVADMLEMLVYKPEDTLLDAASESISDAEQKAVQAQGLLGYLEHLYEKYGEEASATEAWKNAVEELNKVLPGTETILSDQGATMQENIDKLRTMRDEMRKTAIYSAMSKTLEDEYTLLGEQNVALEKAYVQREKAVVMRDSQKNDLLSMIEAYANELEAQLTVGRNKGIDMSLYSERLNGDYKGDDFSTYSVSELAAILNQLVTDLEGAYKTTGTGEEDKLWNKNLLDSLLAPDQIQAISNTLTDYQSQLDEAESQIAALNADIAQTESDITTTEQALERMAQSLNKSSDDVSNAGGSAASSILGAGSSVAGALNSVAARINSVSLPTVKSPLNFSKSYQSHANGLDYVPYDGYLALLHQGERVQTAAEAELSRAYGLMQPQSFDYGAMGNAIGAHMPQGNMTIIWRGRVVADILSEQQANSYRSIERSRWQG